MCLSTVSGNEHIPTAAGYGWKVFRVDGGKVLPEYNHAGFQPYEIGVWYETYGFNEDDKRKVPHSRRYWRGFHIFGTEQGAIQWFALSGDYREIRRVQWRYELARGYQLGISCIVAKEMMILPEA